MNQQDKNLLKKLLIKEGEIYNRLAETTNEALRALLQGDDKRTDETVAKSLHLSKESIKNRMEIIKLTIRNITDEARIIKLQSDLKKDQKFLDAVEEDIQKLA